MTVFYSHPIKEYERVCHSRTPLFKSLSVEFIQALSIKSRLTNSDFCIDFPKTIVYTCEVKLNMIRMWSYRYHTYG